MKLNAFLKYLKANGNILFREGSNQSLDMNAKNGIKSAVSRHPELIYRMCKVICKQTEISSCLIFSNSFWGR
jgi:hypothetical protein